MGLAPFRGELREATSIFDTVEYTRYPGNPEPCKKYKDIVLISPYINFIYCINHG